MSVYREAQDWLESNEMYPGSGLATICWGPNRRYLAALTVRDQLFLFKIDPPDLLLASEPGRGVAGMAFVEEDRLVCRCHPEPAREGATGLVKISVTVMDEGCRVQTVFAETACRTFGWSFDGRYMLLGRGDDASEPAGMLDLAEWNLSNAGDYQADLSRIDGIGLEPDIRFAWVSPDGTRLVIRERSRDDPPRDWFLATSSLEDEVESEPNASSCVTSRIELPRYPWASPTYVWSPDGRWIAARIQEQTPAGWDEIPVGGPDLDAYVAVYDGSDGTRLWSHKVESLFGPFEWTPDGERLEAAAVLWDPATGESSDPAA